jgi:ribonuclease Z
MELIFLGVGAAVPEPARDTACYLLDRRLMIDCGWCGVLRIREMGLDPLDVEALYFTHCHHDHYLGFPALMFYRAMRHRRRPDLPPLRIVGPPDDLPVVVENARRFLQADRFPVVWQEPVLQPLAAGEALELCGFRIETAKALHPVTGVCSRITDPRSGAVLALSGDTGPNAAFAELARGADLMIHEASLRPDLGDAEVRGDHSRSTDAARTAREAGVGRLLLVHLSGDHHAASLAAAREIFAETYLAEDGAAMTLPLTPGAAPARD